MAETEDIELITRVKEACCNDSLEELINRHSALCYGIYNKYSKLKFIDLKINV